MILKKIFLNRSWAVYVMHCTTCDLSVGSCEIFIVFNGSCLNEHTNIPKKDYKKTYRTFICQMYEAS